VHGAGPGRPGHGSRPLRTTTPSSGGRDRPPARRLPARGAHLGAVAALRGRVGRQCESKESLLDPQRLLSSSSRIPTRVGPARPRLHHTTMRADPQCIGREAQRHPIGRHQPWTSARSQGTPPGRSSRCSGTPRDWADCVEITGRRRDPPSDSPVGTRLWDSLQRVSGKGCDPAPPVQLWRRAQRRPGSSGPFGATAYGFGLYGDRLSLATSPRWCTGRTSASTRSPSACARSSARVARDLLQ